ncbi:MAG TPA: prepilin-type N-terminal cleavage/methylation domain-containing protein [Chthoniobacterales bacterium]|nr:prepilin-type N-terminal cleavage/methylation domain-containing protein [Chthoniobacterales bacterium]
MIVAQLFKLRIRGAQIGNSRHIGGFTLVELLVVITIIIILAALVLATVGYVQKKGARSRTEAEIAAMSAACESYKADNGIYPSNSDTNALNARSNFDASASAYSAASLYLYEQLAGVTSGNRSETSSSRTYFIFKPNMLLPAPPSTADVTAIRDPFGNSYGYSTIQAATGDSTKGYNPTFDLWSTVNSTDPTQWIKNW